MNFSEVYDEFLGNDRCIKMSTVDHGKGYAYEVREVGEIMNYINKNTKGKYFNSDCDYYDIIGFIDENDADNFEMWYRLKFGSRPYPSIFSCRVGDRNKT